MLKEAYEAKKLSEEYDEQFKELRGVIIKATRGKKDKKLTEGEYVATVTYPASTDYINLDDAQKVLPAECFKTVIDTTIVKALEKSGKLDKKIVDTFRKTSHTKPRLKVVKT